MKRIVSLFLLLVFAVNLLGVTILFEVQQYQIKQDIKRQIQRGIPESQLCVIRVNETNESAVWWLEEDEFFCHLTHLNSVIYTLRQVAILARLD